MFCVLNPYQIYDLQIFSSILYVVFSFSYNNVFAIQMFLILVKSNLSIFCSVSHALVSYHSPLLPNPKS